MGSYPKCILLYDLTRAEEVAELILTHCSAAYYI